MSTVLLLYAGLGSLIAIGALGIASVRTTIDHVAEGIGMNPGYARLVWFGGTSLFWPVGLYVLSTGRLATNDLKLSAAPVHAFDNRARAVSASLAGARPVAGDHH